MLEERLNESGVPDNRKGSETIAASSLIAVSKVQGCSTWKNILRHDQVGGCLFGLLQLFQGHHQLSSGKHLDYNILTITQGLHVSADGSSGDRFCCCLGVLQT